MEVKYNPKKGRIKLCFNSHEANFMAFLMESVWEERSIHREPVPEVNANFFKNFARAQSDFEKTFSHKDFEFVVSFLDEVIKSNELGEWELSDINLQIIQDFLEVLGPPHRKGVPLH